MAASHPQHSKRNFHNPRYRWPFLNRTQNEIMKGYFLSGQPSLGTLQEVVDQALADGIEEISVLTLLNAIKERGRIDNTREIIVYLNEELQRQGHHIVIKHKPINVSDHTFIENDGSLISYETINNMLEELQGDDQPKYFVIHCKAGQGRSATIMACLLIQKGYFPLDTAKLLSQKRHQAQNVKHKRQRMDQKLAIYNFFFRAAADAIQSDTENSLAQRFEQLLSEETPNIGPLFSEIQNLIDTFNPKKIWGGIKSNVSGWIETVRNSLNTLHDTLIEHYDIDLSIIFKKLHLNSREKVRIFRAIQNGKKSGSLLEILLKNRLCFRPTEMADEIFSPKSPFITSEKLHKLLKKKDASQLFNIKSTKKKTKENKIDIQFKVDSKPVVYTEKENSFDLRGDYNLDRVNRIAQIIALYDDRVDITKIPNPHKANVWNILHTNHQFRVFSNGQELLEQPEQIAHPGQRIALV